MSSERKDGATPPGGGRMSHDVMHAASQLPVEGGGAHDALAASGGLELPGRVHAPGSDAHQRDRANAEMTPPTVESLDKLDRESTKERE